MKLMQSAGINYEVEDDHAVVTGYTGTLTEIIIQDTYQTKTVTIIRKRAFEGLTDITNIYIPDSVTEIQEAAFVSIGYSKEIILPKNLNILGKRSFSTNLFTSIHIPSNVSYIGDSPFGSNVNLRNISISPDNEYYTVIDNIYLYNKLKTVLIQTPAWLNLSSFEPTLVELRSLAIDSCYNQTLTFPFSCSIIRFASIAFSAQLETVYFQGNLIIAEQDAFYSCTSLKNIYYLGVVAVKNNTFGSSTSMPRSIIVCNEYQSNKFATKPFTKRGPCPLINRYYQMTKVVAKQPQTSKTFLNYIAIILL